jgi:hypothetical protein
LTCTTFAGGKSDVAVRVLLSRTVQKLQPSCNGRHMAQTAADLVDHVIPPVPVRQWVISAPKRLRRMLAEVPLADLALTGRRSHAPRS